MRPRAVVRWASLWAWQLYHIYYQLSLSLYIRRNASGVCRHGWGWILGWHAEKRESPIRQLRFPVGALAVCCYGRVGTGHDMFDAIKLDFLRIGPSTRSLTFSRRPAVIAFAFCSVISCVEVEIAPKNCFRPLGDG